VTANDGIKTGRGKMSAASVGWRVGWRGMEWIAPVFLYIDLGNNVLSPSLSIFLMKGCASGPLGDPYINPFTIPVPGAPCTWPCPSLVIPTIDPPFREPPCTAAEATAGRTICTIESRVTNHRATDHGTFPTGMACNVRLCEITANRLLCDTTYRCPDGTVQRVHRISQAQPDGFGKCESYPGRVNNDGKCCAQVWGSTVCSGQVVHMPKPNDPFNIPKVDPDDSHPHEHHPHIPHRELQPVRPPAAPGASPPSR